MKSAKVEIRRLGKGWGIFLGGKLCIYDLPSRDDAEAMLEILGDVGKLLQIRGEEFRNPPPMIQ